MKLSSFNWTRIAGVGIGVLILVAAIVFGVRGCANDERNENNQFVNSGVTKERAANQGKVLTDVQNAQDAISSPTANDQQRVCEKYDRNCAPRDQ